MTIKEREDTSILIRNISMAKGILQRRNTCDNFITTNNISNVSTVRRSFRILGSKQNESNEVKQQTRSIVSSPEIGRRHISVARVAEAFHELQQKLVTKSKSQDEHAPTKNTNSLLKIELSKKPTNQVSKKINMFNKVMRNGSQKDNTKCIKDNEILKDNKNIKDENNNKNKKMKKDIEIVPFNIPPTVSTITQKKIIINIENGLSIAAKHDITEEELLYIRKRKAIGRSNSAMIPLRELVMTREVANSRRSLSLSLIPEDETLSLLEAVERRLNLSKETNLCDTVL